jgi:endonuclease/exonuclease/phosphatase (EEP) superfamily protein YafD
VLISGGWIVVAILAFVVAVRTFGQWRLRREAIPVLALSAISPWLLFFAWPLFVLALIGRQWIIAVLAAGLCALQASWIQGRIRKRRRHLDESGEAVLRVLTVNLRFNSADISELISEIRSADPSVIVFQELTPAHLEKLKATLWSERYCGEFVVPAKGGTGIGIWSRVPISEVEIWDLSGSPQLLCWLRHDGCSPVRFWGVHIPAPHLSALAPNHWASALDELARKVRAISEPCVIAGDFNSTWDHKPFRQLLKLGLRDAAAVAGRGLVGTWPNHRIPGVPSLQLDHVLVSPDLAIVDTYIGVARGSDHRPVIADVAVPLEDPRRIDSTRYSASE